MAKIILTFPLQLTERARDQNSDIARTMIAEQKLFALRREARDGRKAQLKERISQLE